MERRFATSDSGRLNDAAAVFDALSVGAYGRRTMRHTLAAATLLACLIIAGTAAAQRVGSLAEWKQRGLEPASIGLELYPGSAFNMKFTIDQIRLDESPAKMAVYLIPPGELEAAAQFFAKQLGTTVELVDQGSLGPLRNVAAKKDDAKRAGLTIRVEASEWATGKGQIWLRQDVPAAAKEQEKPAP